MADQREVTRGSWAWALRVGERIGYVTILALFIILHAAGLEAVVYRRGIALVGILLVTVWTLFRVVFPRLRYDPRAGWLGVLAGSLASAATYLVLKEHAPSAQLFFVPPIVVAGLVGSLVYALASAGLAIAAFLAIGYLIGRPLGAVEAILNCTVFAFAGAASGLLSEEVRRHFKREMEEHRLAVTVGQRLTAVMGAIEEAIVFSDRQGMVRMINRRAEELFALEPGSDLDAPVVQLLRLLARRTEDPEGFMEAFQELRDDPEKELRWNVEQIIPERRILRVLSRPVRSRAGTLVGRIDVYTDISEGIRRADELESAYDEARKTAESYQRGLLPKSVPSLPRVGLVAHYIAAAGARAVCGDFYDFITLKDGRIGLVMGDVCGIGPAAVNDAALTRYTMRSLTASISDPGEVLEAFNEQVADGLGADRFVRVVFAALDPERAVLEYANAGHVPPIMYRCKRGNIDWLGEGGLPIGVANDERYKTGRVELDPGDMLFFYTDGVTEAPRLGKPMGQGRLSDLIRQYGVGTPGELVQAIRRSVEAWVDKDLRDDLAMLGCQVLPDTAVDSSARELVLPNEVSRTREIRDFVAAFLADLRVKVDTSTEILIAAGEAAGNAVRYGKRPKGRSEIRVRCLLDGEDVVVVVADDGPGFEVADGDVAEPEQPDPLAAGGRGLFLMSKLSDSCRVESTPEGTTVTLVRRAFDAPVGPPG